MIQRALSLSDRYRNKGVLVDSSLLLVYLLGGFDRRQLPNCRAIKSSFTPDEFDLLASLIARFTTLITTPHILTEVSNLAGKLPSTLYAPFRIFIAQVIGQFEEEFVAATQVTSQESFVRFGLTDAAITTIAPGRYLVLTEDAALYGFLSRRKVDVINFNHIRLSGRS